LSLCSIGLDALRASGLQMKSNVRLILDGEEEASSQGLISSIAQYKKKYRADTMLVLDGPLHASGKPTLVFGGRGISTLELTVFGPKFGLHSGHYGNWARNPAINLIHLVGSMKNDDGRVLLEGFYDDVPPFAAEEKRILASVPDDPKEQQFFGLHRLGRLHFPQRFLQILWVSEVGLSRTNALDGVFEFTPIRSEGRLRRVL
jgi:acetylornithine deacetylase/succinyl-diaminopimelate desuccinylase-like protein